ncbi:Vms1/Ankzf1 family peptidyl-tRNA hydrolase [Actinopolymorpha rutila]|uniref:Peptide chain release factor 1 (ERF1) n=1 Tax=Actinopolymorpha rutila TaxID=446787 RepID=A0A852ZUS5_9ACTN|nr:Vms1/Ankzf1 family peptidyl-tRNA hydrolase [Actinopolymorpha rutila]NYH92730.1 hypothetical protein [Actinopolymorpha rutila]
MRLSPLNQIFERPGPIVTAYLEPGAVDANSETSVDLRWRAVAEQLLADGADEQTVEAAGKAVTEQPPGRTAVEGIVVVAASGEVLFTDSLHGPVGGDHVSWAPLPHLAAYVRANADTRRYGVVVVDSSGADFVVRGAPAGGHGEGGHGDGHTEVRGEQRPLNKVRGGALSNRRMQNAVEETADRNAKLVADNIVRLVESAKLSSVLLVGAVEARSRVVHHLPHWVQELVRTSDRAGSGDVDAEAESALDDAVAEIERLIQDDLVERLRSRMSAGTGAEGAADVLQALRQGAVDTLLLAEEDPDNGNAPEGSRRRIAIGAGAAELASDASELRRLFTAGGSADSEVSVSEEALDEALIRAGAASDAVAEVVSAEAGLRDGVGALLRFAPSEQA